MRKIEESKLLYALVFSALVTLFGIALYPIFDVIICKYFTHTLFTYSIIQHVISPILLGLIVFIILLIFKRK